MQDLIESERRFRVAVAQAPLIAWTTDADLNFTWGVGGALGSTGLDARAFRGRRLADLFPGDAEPSPEAQHRHALAGERVHYAWDWMGRSFDVRLEPLREGDGHIVGVAGVALDLTDRKQAEEQLRRSEDRFVLLGRATSDMAWDWDLETDGIWRNENLEAVFGYTAEDTEPTGTWWESRIHPDDRDRVVSGLHTAIERADRSWSAEYRWRRKDGRYATILDRGYIITDERGKAVRMVGSTVDITKHRREEAIREAIYKISEAAVSTQGLPHLYREVHRIVGELMPAQNFYIALYDAATEMLNFPYFVDQEESTPAPYRAGRGLTEYVLRSGKPFYASTEGYAKLVASGEVVRLGPLSIDWVGVPLTANGRTIGVLVVQTYTEGVRYGVEDRDVLSFVSEQIAMAIERKRDQEALAAAEAKFRGLVEQSLTGIYIIQDERFAYVTPRLAEIFGYTQAEMVPSMGPLDVTAPEDRTLVQENIRRRIQGEIGSIHYSFHGTRKDGARIAVEVEGGQMEYGGRPAIIGSLLDVTEREKATEELRKSETRFRTLFEAAADAILLVNRNGTILDANPTAGALIARDRSALVGTSLEAWLSSEDLERARAYLRDCFRDPAPSAPFEIAIPTPSGRRRSVAVRSCLVSESGSEPYLEMLIRDVTEQREMQRRLVASERLASVGQMAAYVAHEINTPLANISLLAAASKRRTRDPEVQERLDKIDVQRRQAAMIITDLLSFAKHREIQPADVDLRTVLVAAVDQIEPYRSPDVALVQEYGELPVSAYVDPLQMQEVFVNLLKNAFEATTKGSVTVRLESRPGYRIVSVSDTGYGIPEEVQARMFQPFVTSKRHRGGTGLGLALCRNIVSAHGGEIHFTTTARQGTTFTVTLPQPERP